MSKRVLFVDDEHKVLSGLRRILFPLRKEWDMRFVDSAETALEEMQEEGFDVLVTDLRMPGMDGLELIREVRARFPEVVRLVLSGESTTELLLRAGEEAHQVLSKPCDPDILKAGIERTLSLRSLLRNERLVRLTTGMTDLPSPPRVYAELREIVSNPEAQADEVGRVVEKDPGLTARILRTVNSALFGLRREISNPGEAAAYLGLDAIRNLALAIETHERLRPQRVPPERVEVLFAHGLAVGYAARAIASMEEAGVQTADHAQVAGMLHDVGYLVLMEHTPEKVAAAQRLARKIDGMTLEEAERRVMGASHAEVGAYLMGIWGMPMPVVEAIAYHHRPASCAIRLFAPLTAVHVADAIQESAGCPVGADPRPRIDFEYLEELGLSDRAEAWIDACHEKPERQAS